MHSPIELHQLESCPAETRRPQDREMVLSRLPHLGILLGPPATRKAALGTQCARMRGESSQVEQKSSTASGEKESDADLTYLLWQVRERFENLNQARTMKEQARQDASRLEHFGV